MKNTKLTEEQTSILQTIRSGLGSYDIKNTKLTEEQKTSIVQTLNSEIGSNCDDVNFVYTMESYLIRKRDKLQGSLNVVSHEVPTKLSQAISKAETNSKQVEELKEKSEQLKIKMQQFLDHTEPLRNELNDRFAAIGKYEGILVYLKLFEKVEDLGNQLKQCTDDEQAVQLYSELKEMCHIYLKGHQGTFVKESTHYWHNVLKDKFTKQYEDVLKLLKWPFTTAQEHSPPPKEVLSQFSSITRYLLLIEEPKDFAATPVTDDFDQDPCLPVRILLRPLKKRFLFHFTGPRQTARIDRPEWFLTQTLTWIKDHQGFIRRHVQQVPERLHMRNIRAEDEFNAGLISFAAERLHTVLGLYHSQGSKGDTLDVDAAFAHAVDETLGFHKELVQFTGKDNNTVLSVLTKAETFIKWLAVEKKYALAKMEETLGSEQWMEMVCAGTNASSEVEAGWVPRGADWLIALLKTIQDRYTMLPQPGHRLQFLELQLELIEEWRVRLTQLLSAAMNGLTEDSFLAADDSPHPLTAVINSAHHTRMVLQQWTHALHYLQLHYYKRQFQHFTQQQHRDGPESVDEEPDSTQAEESLPEQDIDETMSLKEVEVRAHKLALNEVIRRDSSIPTGLDDEHSLDSPEHLPRVVTAITFPRLPATLRYEDEDAGVFGEAPSLLAHLRDAGLNALTEHILLEFRAGLRDYQNQKWHAMPLVEQMALTVSAPLCRPLGGLCARMHAANAKLAPTLGAKLRARLAAEVDEYVYEEVVLRSWWNTGGTVQFSHDVKRNLLPAFAPPNKIAADLNLLPKLLETCKLLDMDYDEANRLREDLVKFLAPDSGEAGGYPDLEDIKASEALQILNKRTDLADDSPPSVMELF